MVFSRPAMQFRQAPSVPSVPFGVTSVAADGAATVSWQHPGDNGTAAYTVTAYASGVTPGPWARAAAGASSATVSGLTNSTPYAFTVKAANSGGYSAESAISAQNTPLASLLFGDDFNGSLLDPAWTVSTRDGDQSAPEGQYWLPSQVTLDGSSNLVITFAVQSVTAPTYNDANPPGYGGSLVTRSCRSGQVQWTWPGALAPAWPAATGFTARGFNLTYGKVQVRAKVASGTNIWPAFWMLGANCEQTNPLDPSNVGTCNWPNAGSEEIDVAEFRYGNATSFNCAMQSGGTNFGPNSNAVTSGDTTYHTYEADWSPGLVNWLLDGVQVQTTATTVPAGAMFLILQCPNRGGVPSVTTPATVVDWVRVFHN